MKNLRSFKKLFIVMIVIIQIVMLSACQPTPEKTSIINKGDDALEEAIAKTASPLSDAQVTFPIASDPTATEDYQWEYDSWQYEETLDKGAIISIDATIRKPATEKLPVIKVSSSAVKEGAEMQRIAEAVYPGATLYQRELIFYKEDYEEFILQLREEMFEYENQLKSTSITEEQRQNLSNSIIGAEDLISHYEKQMVNAPAGRLLVSPTYIYEKDEYGKPYVSFMANVNGLRTELDFSARDDDGFLSVWTSSNFLENIWNKTYVPMELTNSDIAAKSAQAIAEDCINRMGIDFHLYSIRLGENDGEYVFHYTRLYNGVLESYAPEYWRFDDRTVEGVIFRPLWRPEFITISIKNNNLVYFQWRNISKIDTIENDNVDTISFEDIQPILLTQLKRIFDQELYQAETVAVDRIELGLTKIVIQNTDEYRMVPTWNIWGLVEGNHIATQYSCLATINAIDGSLIDRSVMY